MEKTSKKNTSKRVIDRKEYCSICWYENNDLKKCTVIINGQYLCSHHGKIKTFSEKELLIS